VNVKYKCGNLTGSITGYMTLHATVNITKSLAQDASPLPVLTTRLSASIMMGQM